MKNIIVSPIITEKSMKAVEAGKYSFLVSRLASKTAIKQAIAGMFKVNIVNVYTILIKGKRKRIGARRVEVTDSEIKKAIVTLKNGEKIGLFEPGGTEEEKKESKKGKEKKLKV
jgi:large subunit ribosomal protein L23